jgi:predicted KAP-like P-loop ATPase
LVGREESADGTFSPHGDHPVRSRAEDSLGRTSFAEVIARQIASTESEEGVVFGIVGAWGSGKTSLLNMVGEALEEDYGDVVVLRFNPWLFSGTEHLVGVFFEELGAQLLERPDERLKKVGEALETYGGILGALHVVPGIGYWATIAEKGTGVVGRWLTRRGEEERTSLLGQRRKLEAALGDLSKKVVVMVDDLDRLRLQEIRDVVGLVRLNADLPNIVFVLAYDRERVEEALAGEEGDGRAYLEKIVQVVHDVPKVRDVDLTLALSNAVNGVLEHMQETGPFDERRFEGVFALVIRPLFRNVRDVRRYANALPASLEVVGDEVALDDILALEALRVLLPEVYDEIASSVEALTTPAGHSGGLSGNSARDQEAKRRIQRIMEAAGEHSGAVRELIGRVFPAGARHFENISYGHDHLKEWSRDRRLAHPRVLRFYLEKQLPGNVLPARRIQEIFDALGNEQRLFSLLDNLNSDQLGHVLERLLDFEDHFPPHIAQSAVPVLMNQSRYLPEGRKRFMAPTAEERLQRLVRRLLEKVNEEARTQVVQLMMPKVCSLSDRLVLVLMAGHRQGWGLRLLPHEEADMVERQWVTVVLNADLESLSRERKLLHVLYLACEIDPERTIDLAQRVVARDDGFLGLLSSSLTEEQSLGTGDVVPRTEPRLPCELLESVVGTDLLEQRVKEMANRRDDRVLDPKTALAPDTAERYVSGWRPDW